MTKNMGFGSILLSSSLICLTGCQSQVDGYFAPLASSSTSNVSHSTSGNSGNDGNPDSNPSPSPSVNPTGIPTIIPSASPSVTPSVSPSTYPSTSPSTYPSVIPSVKPSVTPSPSSSSSTSSNVLPCLSDTASIVGLSNSKLQFAGNALIRGSVVLFGSSTLTLTGNANVMDQVYTQNPNSISETPNASVGSIVTMDLSQKEAPILAFAKSAEQLPATQSFDNINGSMTIAGNGAINVIHVKNGIMLAGNQSLVLNGSAKDQFIFIVENGGVQLAGNSGIIAKGLAPQNILFISEGNNPLGLTGNGAVSGTFMAPESSARIAGNGQIEGSVFAHGEISITGNGLSFLPAAWCPQSPSDPGSNSSPSPSSGGGLIGI